MFKVIAETVAVTSVIFVLVIYFFGGMYFSKSDGRLAAALMCGCGVALISNLNLIGFVIGGLALWLAAAMLLLSFGGE